MVAVATKKKVLFAALFATGLSGIVAEYCFATLATYFVGDSVKQWAIIISLMLFSMGLGSRLTKFYKGNVFRLFVLTEFALSVVVGFSAISTYYLAGQIEYIGIYIYTMALLTGLLIGMELPLAMRLNEEFEALKLNVANILEKDYYGSLIGGLFFVFVGLPYLGLSYTPFLLGFVNLSTAVVLLFYFKDKLKPGKNKTFSLGAGLVLVSLVLGCWFAAKIVLHGEQKKYKDKIVYQEQSVYQKIVVTQWKEDYWLYLNDNLQFSTFDEPMYHEVLVHPMMHLLQQPRHILILGGGDGCAARELLKYPTTVAITVVDLDQKLTDIFTKEPFLAAINKNAFADPKVKVINTDGFQFMKTNKQFFDLIIIDLPDPRSVELSRLYTKEFYQLCAQSLTERGGIITQAGSPYYTPKAFKCIEKTMAAAGFSTLPLHNQVLSMGEWGWIAGTKRSWSKKEMKTALYQYQDTRVPTAWLNQEAMQLISTFGKDYYGRQAVGEVAINQLGNPVLYRYYNQADWSTY